MRKILTAFVFAMFNILAIPLCVVAYTLDIIKRIMNGRSIREYIREASDELRMIHQLQINQIRSL